MNGEHSMLSVMLALSQSMLDGYQCFDGSCEGSRDTNKQTEIEGGYCPCALIVLSVCWSVKTQLLVLKNHLSEWILIMCGCHTVGLLNRPICPLLEGVQYVLLWVIGTEWVIKRR